MVTTSSTHDDVTDDVWDLEEIVGVAIICLLVPFIIMGNIFVIYAVVKFRRLQVPTNYLLVSLAIADVCTGIFVPFITLLEVYKGHVTDIVLCLVPHCLIMTVGGASMLCLTAVAWDRYTAISRPLEYMAIVTEKKIVIFTVVSWVYATLIAWAPLYGWYTPLEPMEGPGRTESPGVSTMPGVPGVPGVPGMPGMVRELGTCSFNLIKHEALILLLTAIFLPPYLVIFFCYTKILLVARHHANAIAARETAMATQLESHFLQKDTKYAKTLGIVIGLYILLWLPYQLSILTEVVGLVTVEDWVRNYLAFLCYLNSGLNPWIFAFRNKDFKFAFRQLWNSLAQCRCGRLDRADSVWSTLISSRARSLSTGNIAGTSGVSGNTLHPPLPHPSGYTLPGSGGQGVTASALDLAGHKPDTQEEGQKRRGSVFLQVLPGTIPRGPSPISCSPIPCSPIPGTPLPSPPLPGPAAGSDSLPDMRARRDSFTMLRDIYRGPRRSVGSAWTGAWTRELPRGADAPEGGPERGRGPRQHGRILEEQSGEERG